MLARHCRALKAFKTCCAPVGEEHQSPLAAASWGFCCEASARASLLVLSIGASLMHQSSQSGQTSDLPSELGHRFQDLGPNSQSSEPQKAFPHKSSLSHSEGQLRYLGEFGLRVFTCQAMWSTNHESITCASSLNATPTNCATALSS